MLKKRILIAVLILVLYYFLICNLSVTVTEKQERLMISPSNYTISENCIIVRGQATTGPELHVVEGADYLAAEIAQPHPGDLNTKEIEMLGKSIYSILDYPDYYACDWLVFGRVVGTTDEYEICGSGTIPIFEANKVYPIMSIAEFFALETVMFAMFPLGLIFALLIYLAPVGIAVLLVFRKKTHRT